MSKHPNWDELKTEYETSDISYRDMAKKYNIPLNTLNDAARKAKWVEARKQYRQLVCAKTRELASDEKASKLAGIAFAADKMSDVIQKVMQDSDQFFRKVDMTTGQEVVGKKVDSKAMRELTAAMKDLTAVIRNVWNIPTEAESVSMQLARERLEIEKRKAETMEELEYGISAGVVLIPSVEEDEDDE